MTFQKVDIKKIRDTRIKKGISIEKMSELMGFESYQGYYKKESGLRNFSALDISKVSKILDLKFDDIFFTPRITKKETIIS